METLTEMKDRFKAERQAKAKMVNDYLDSLPTDELIKTLRDLLGFNGYNYLYSKLKSGELKIVK